MWYMSRTYTKTETDHQCAHRCLMIANSYSMSIQNNPRDKWERKIQLLYDIVGHCSAPTAHFSMEVINGNQLEGTYQGTIEGSGVGLVTGKINQAIAIRSNSYIQYGQHQHDCYHNPDMCDTGLTQCGCGWRCHKRLLTRRYWVLVGLGLIPTASVSSTLPIAVFHTFASSVD